MRRNQGRDFLTDAHIHSRIPKNCLRKGEKKGGREREREREERDREKAKKEKLLNNYFPNITRLEGTNADSAKLPMVYLQAEHYSAT